MIKKAAAQVQMELNLMDPKMGRAIIRAANEVIAGDHNDQFVVDVYQAGAGTSFNMNVNEVVANRAIEFLNGERGDYSIVHPNDHVNMGQSTNDTFPTAIRMATCLHLQPMYKAIEGLKKSFRNKGKQYAKYVKAGRTHLQDAAPVTLGQEFQAWADTLTDCLAGIHQAEESIRELGIGGSAVGTGLNTHPRYSAMMVTQLSKLARIPFRRSKNLHKSMQSQYPVAHVSSALRNTSLEMIRISNDLRLLSSGPTSGIGEIILPPVQPGSSIMPGKVNPVMTECWNMTLFDIWGRDQTIAGCVQAGQYELNVMMPMMAYALLHNIEILTNISRVVSQRCIDGIQADAKVCRDYALKTVSLATALNPLIGYENAAKVVKKAVATKKSIIDVAVEMGFVGKAEVTRVLEPLKMIQPGIAKKGSKSAAKTAKKSNKRPKKNTKPSKKAVKQKSSAKKGPKRRNKAKKKK
jgi:aspartate ammonia-lyase